MRYASLAAAAALLAAASPAWASGTIACRSTLSPSNGPTLWLTVGAGGIVQARLELGQQRLATGQGAGAPIIAQSWIDRDMLKLDILDANADERLVRLDTRRRRGTDYLGILIHAGRTWRVRCDEEG